MAIGTQASDATVVRISQDTIDDLIHRVVEVAHPLRIILFGSAARGEMGSNSDLDILVVVPDGAPARKLAQRIHVRLIGFPLPVDVVAVTESDLRLYGDTLGLVYRPALRDGRILYAA